MKVPPAQTDSFLKAPPSEVQFVLFYGPDTGQVVERTTALSQVVADDVNDPFSVVDLHFKAVKDDPAILADEIGALCFTGGRRLIRVRNVEGTFPKALQSVLQETKGDAFVIFSAAELTPKSTTRSFFEKGKNTAAIACYIDEGAGLRKIIENALSKENIRIDSQTIQYLEHCLPRDRMAIHSELQKLVTYANGKERVEYEDVTQCIGQGAEHSLDELCHAVASGNHPHIQSLLTQLFSQGENPIGLIKAVTRYFLRLQLARGHITSGLSEKDAMSKLRPPVFFKSVPMFKAHLQSWSEQALNRAVYQLMEAEIACKTHYNESELLCRRCLTALPQMKKQRAA